TLEVVERRFALVEGKPAEPDLLLGARQPVLCRLLRVPLDAVRELDGRPDELERLEPSRAVVLREAGAVGKVGIGREPLELREGNDVRDGLELVLFPLHGVHGWLARASQAWISQPR